MVCLQEDDFTRSTFLEKSRWEARLSDGSLCIQDDDRPGLVERSAWIRLGDYIQETGLEITSIIIRFRSNVIDPLPHNADGYFIRSGVVGVMDQEQSKEIMIIGYFDFQRNQVYTQSYYLPELMLLREEWRDLTIQLVGPSLIKNDKYRSRILKDFQIKAADASPTTFWQSY